MPRYRKITSRKITSRRTARVSSSSATSVALPAAPEPAVKRSVVLPRVVSVKHLAELLGMSPVEIIKELMRNGLIASINQVVDYNAAAVVASNLGFEPREEETRAVLRHTLKRTSLSEEAGLLKPRPPVVTIMGHVDHGKTSLLDAIRQTNVTATEAGSITQHIGAYQVEVNAQKITFLDTPGHEAFTAMRARGAQVTDIVVLVVAADDGVMPQTIEALDHAKAAGVPIVVAINKMDKSNANPDKVKQQLADHSLVLEEWGGDVVCMPVSAKKRQGISELLENILLVAEMAELKANPNRRAEGVVIEARMDSSRGPLATVLIQDGTLRVSDTVVVGETWGRIKAMFNEKGQRLRKAEPATPVELMGLAGLPQAGDRLNAVADDRVARIIVQKRQERQQAVAAKALTLDQVYAQIKAGEVKGLNIILKTDVQGSIEPIHSSLERLETEQSKVRIIHSGTGAITETDVMLAVASKAIIIGFNTSPDLGARRLAETDGVDIRLCDVIYNVVEDIQKALVGMLEPVFVEVVEGHGEVIAAFVLGKKGKVAGVRVKDGVISRGAGVRVIRGKQVIHDSSITSLKHFKEDVKEMAAGFECGVGVEGFPDFQVGDALETYRKERRSGA